MIPLKLKKWSLLLFAIFLLYLAGFYFGSFIMTLFYFFLFLPLLSVALCIASYFGLKYIQSFDTEHPVKGEDIHYNLNLANEGILPIFRIHCLFKTINPHMDLAIPDFSSYLSSRSRIERQYTFRCSYRGIYTVGLERIRIDDPFGLLSFTSLIQYRTFYVYPRILELIHFPLGLQNSEGTGTGMAQGGDPDYSVYTQFRSYRAGESTRHIHWKKFASTGKPFIKVFETTAEPEMRIFFDLRTCVAHTGALRTGTLTTAGQALETEDTSVEILVALVKYFLDREVSLSVKAPGRKIYTFDGASPSHFEAFYLSTMQLIFQDTISPSDLYLSESRTSSTERGSIFFISHFMDAALFSLIEASGTGGKTFTLIFNQVGYGEGEKQRNLFYINRLRERGARIIVVNSPDTIVEDLGGKQIEAAG